MKIRSGESITRSIEDLFEDMYIELYERSVVEIEDVFSVQRWISDLAHIGYTSDVSGKENTRHGGLTINVNVGQSLFYYPKGASQSCTELERVRRKLTFWTSTWHAGTRLDYPTILATLNQTIVVATHNGFKDPFPDALNSTNIIIPEKISPTLQKYNLYSYVTDKLVRSNLDYYKNDTLFQSVDAFYCGFYASQCQLFMPLNATKSILYITAHRYNFGRCTKDSWIYLTKQLQELALLNLNNIDRPKHIVGGSSRYDVEYLRYYTGLGDAIELFSSFGQLYTKPGKYKPTEPEILLSGKLNMGKLRTNRIKSFKFVTIKAKYGHYTMNDVLKHKAVVYVTYSVMSYKLTDFYSINIPIFVPYNTLFSQSRWLRQRSGKY